MLNSIISWIVNKLWEGHWYWWSEHTEFNRARYRSGSHFLSSQIKPFFETGYIFRGRVLVFFCLLPFYSWLFDKEPKLCWLVTIVCEQTNKNRFFQSRNTYKNSWVRYHPFFGKSLTRDYYDNPDLKNLSRMETVKDFSFVHS